MQEGALAELKTQRVFRFYNGRIFIGNDISGQSAGDIDSDPAVWQLVDVIDEACYPALRGAAEAGAEYGIDDDNMRRYVCNKSIGLYYTYEVFIYILQPLKIGLAIGRKFFAEAQQKSLNSYTALVQQPGDGEPVATIIAGAAEHYKKCFFRKVVFDPLDAFSRRPLHQFDRVNWGSLYGIGIAGADLCGGEYFHFLMSNLMNVLVNMPVARQV